MSAVCLWYWEGELPPAPDQYEIAPAWLAQALGQRIGGGWDPEEIGLFLATADAGAQASVALWAEATAQGPGFASPRAFPWTLASSAAGHLAQALGLHGPVVTLVGGAEALLACLDHAMTYLDGGRLAIVAALSLPVEARSARAAAVGLAREGEGMGVVRRAAVGADRGRSDDVVALLREVGRALDSGQAVTIGHPDEGGMRWEPPGGGRPPGG